MRHGRADLPRLRPRGPCRVGCRKRRTGFSAASGMSFEEVFHFAYARSFIPTMKNLAGRVGMEVIQDTACETAAQVIGGVAASLPDRSLAAWAAT